MFVEVGITYNDSIDHLSEVINANKEKFGRVNQKKDELLIQQQGNSSENWEIKYGPKQLSLTMDSCPSYEHFIEVLENNLSIVSSTLVPNEIICMGVRGFYLYPISSVEEFSQLASSWTGSYFDDSNTQIRINDMGVDVDFHEGTLNISITCEFLSREQAREFFPSVDLNTISKMNFFIDLKISTDEPFGLQKTLSLALGNSIKRQINQATKIMEQKLEKIYGK
jgi:hypothetical protein